MSLTDFQVKNAKAKDKVYSLKDEKGLYLYIRPSGKKSWRLRYWLNGKENTVTLGEYPAIGLKEARIAQEDARKLVSVGVKPKIKKYGVHEEEIRTDNRFEDIASEYLHIKRKEYASQKSLRTLESRVNHYLIPALGHLLPDEITAPILLSVIKRIEAKGALETAHRTLGIVGQIFRYAIISGKASRDPSQDLRGALQSAPARHFSAIVKPSQVGELMRACEDYEGTEIVRIALLVTAYTFVRQNELRHMEWHEVDICNAEWRIPAGKMKIRRPHIVPLSTQVIALLERLREITKHGKYAFSSERSPRGDIPMSENTVNAALRRMGFTKHEMTAHGFRTTASTLLYESGKWSEDAIEKQLSHQERNQVKEAYSRAQRLDERREMMQWWADYLDGLKESK